jgi:RND family efflux transporter MFP subunit
MDTSMPDTFDPREIALDTGLPRPPSTRQRPVGRLWHAWMVCTLLSGAGFATASCGSADHPAQARESREPVSVAVEVARRTPRAALVEAGGLVQAGTTAVITSRVMAPVREVRVTPGDTVRAGQVLVVLDDRDVDAQARGARANATGAGQSVTAAVADREAAVAGLALARASHGRVASLQARKSATTQELDESTAALRAAEARLASTEARLQHAQSALDAAHAGSEAAAVTAGFASITAPFAGVVTEKLVEPGNMAMPGSPLLRIEERGALRLDVRVDAARVAGLSRGQHLDVVLDADEPIRLQGTVSEVARAMDADARAYVVKVALPADTRLRSGMFGRAQLPGPAAPVLAVPVTAVVRRGQITTVFVAERQVARLRMVVLGRTFHDRVEVVTGLSDGEPIITAPPLGLTDGAPIRAGAAR